MWTDQIQLYLVEANDSAHFPIERCPVVNAEETVRQHQNSTTGKRNSAWITRLPTMMQLKTTYALVSSNDKLHIEQVCKKKYSLSLQFQRCRVDRTPRCSRGPKAFAWMQLLVYSTLVLFNPLMLTGAI